MPSQAPRERRSSARPEADDIDQPPSQADTRQSWEAEPSASARTAALPDSVSSAPPEEIL